MSRRKFYAWPVSSPLIINGRRVFILMELKKITSGFPGSAPRPLTGGAMARSARGSAPHHPHPPPSPYPVSYLDQGKRHMPELVVMFYTVQIMRELGQGYEGQGYEGQA